MLGAVPTVAYCHCSIPRKDDRVLPAHPQNKLKSDLCPVQDLAKVKDAMFLRRIEPGQGGRYHVELRPRESWIGNPIYMIFLKQKNMFKSAEFPGHPSQLARLLTLLHLFGFLCDLSLFFLRTWSFPMFSLLQNILCCPASESWFFASTATVVDETAIWTAEDLTLYNFIVPILSLPNTILKDLFCLNLTCLGLSFFAFLFGPTRSRFRKVRVWGTCCLNLGILALPWSLGFGSTITRSATFQALLQDIPFAAFSAISIFGFACILFACILLTLLPWPLLPPSLQTFALLGAHGILHGRRENGRSFDLQRINSKKWNIISAVKPQTQKIFKTYITGGNQYIFC